MRQLRPTCAQCVFWTIDNPGETATAGHCHRYPPGVYVNPQSGVVVQKFPSTDRHHWCGEWSSDEERWTEAFRHAAARATGGS